ncbi:MAG: flippase [Patescibacteria group bacterium]
MIAIQSIARNASYALVSTVIQKALTLFYFILVARTYGPAEQGLYSAALAYTTLFGVLIDLGLSSALVRETARNPDGAQRFLSAMLVVRLVLSVVVYALMIAVAHGIGYSSDLVTLLYVAGVIACIDVVATSCWGIMRGFQNLLYESIGGVLGIGAMIFFGGGAMLLGMPVFALVWAVLAGSVANLIFVLALLVRKARLKLILRISWPALKELSLLAAPFAAAALFSRITTFGDMALLPKLGGEVHAGYYSAANKLILALNMIPAAVSSGLFPALSSSFARGEDNLGRRYCRAHFYLLLISLPMAAGIALLSSPLIFFFYGLNYAPTSAALQILAPALLFGFLMFPVGALLAATNRQYINTIIFGIAALFNIVINIILIPRFFSSGAALASVTSNGIIFFLSFFMTRETWLPQVKFMIFSLAKILGATAVMAGVLLVVREQVHVLWAILCGIGAYGMSVCVFRIIPDEDWKKFTVSFKRS